ALLNQQLSFQSPSFLSDHHHRRFSNFLRLRQMFPNFAISSGGKLRSDFVSALLFSVLLISSVD
ncbi:MAG: hypothetical protein MHMPM18_004880, partial [Marteilia pararefringens]